MTDARKLVMTVTLPVRWADMDENGHVNNAAYFTYMEQARIDWFHSIRVQNTSDGHGLVVVSASCDYVRPLAYPATIAITVECGKPGRSSFPIYNSICLDGDPAVKFAEGRTMMVWVDRQTGKSVPLPESIRQLLA